MTDPMDIVLAPVFFSTSNLAKLSQARLVLGRFGFEVNKYLQHQKPYEEPYGKEREEFLAIGLSEVIRRAGRGSIVFIEDTTVRIHGLSSADCDFPGQETKEWFARTTHEDLIQEIDRVGGGSRRVTVRSDIALYVPGLDRYVFFAGHQSGHVADKPAEVKPNAAYPWLGNEDFSSWFIPDGSVRTLSSMSYEESVPFDYREKCLRSLAGRLQEYQAIGRSSSALLKNTRPSRPKGQISLVAGLRVDTIVVVVGAIGSGKTTVRRRLVMDYNFKHIEGSEAIVRLALDCSISEQRGFDAADKLFSSYGLDVVEKEVVWPTFERVGGPFVYTGARTLEGLLYLRRKAVESGLQCVIWHVEAPEMTRHVRVVERVRDGEDVSAAGFRTNSERDIEYGAAKYGDIIADCHIGNVRGMQTFLDSIARAVVDPVGQYGKPPATRRRRWLRSAIEGRLFKKLADEYPDLITNEDDQEPEFSGRGETLLRLIELS